MSATKQIFLIAISLTIINASLFGELLNVHQHVHKKVHEVASAVTGGLTNLNLNLEGHVGVNHQQNYAGQHHNYQVPGAKPGYQEVIVVVNDQSAEQHGGIPPPPPPMSEAPDSGYYGQGGSNYGHGGGGGNYAQGGNFGYGGGYHHHHSYSYGSSYGGNYGGQWQQGNFPQPGNQHQPPQSLPPLKPTYGEEPHFPSNKPGYGFPHQPINDQGHKPDGDYNKPNYNQGNYKPGNYKPQLDNTKPNKEYSPPNDNELKKPELENNEHNSPLQPPINEPVTDFKPTPGSSSQSNYGNKPTQSSVDTQKDDKQGTKKPNNNNDDEPLFVPLHDYTNGDLLYSNGPKRETQTNKPANNDDEEFPIDIRFKDE